MGPGPRPPTVAWPLGWEESVRQGDTPEPHLAWEGESRAWVLAGPEHTACGAAGTESFGRFTTNDSRVLKTSSLL